MIKQIFATIFIGLLTGTNAIAQLNFALLDETFGTLGRATLNQGVATTGSSDNQGRRTMHLLDNGKIVLVGTGKASGTDYDVFVGRMNSDGTPDTNFGLGGSVFVHCGGTADIAWGSTIAPDQSIVIAGTYVDPFGTGFDNILIVWLNEDGTLRSEFDTDGIWTMNISATSTSQGQDVKVTPDGKLYVAFQTNVVSGNPGKEFALMRLNPDGSFDTTFGTNGIVYNIDPATPDNAYRLVLQADGKIVLGGTKGGSPMKYQFVRFDANGALDDSFGTNGVVTFAHPNNLNIPNFYNLTIEADGKIVAGTNVTSGSTSFASIVRLNSDGSPDAGFGQNGVVQLGNPTTARAVLKNSDNDYYIVGADFSLVMTAKISNSGNLIFGFGANGVAPYGSSIPNSVDLTGVIQPDGKFLIGGRVSETGIHKYGVLRTGGIGNAIAESTEYAIKIYPNPTSGPVTISNPGRPSIAYTLMSGDGKLIETGMLTGNNSLNIAGLASGLYLLKLEGSTHRIMVE